MKANFRRAAVAIVVACWFGDTARLRAQQPFQAEAVATPAGAASSAQTDFSYDLGHLSQQEADVRSVYSLKATQPRDSKLVGQKIRLIIEDTTPQGTKTRLLTLNTGKHKTVAQFCGTLRDILRKYQSLGEGANGQEIGKIGDLKYGGEIVFVAESPTHLRYDMRTEGEEDHSTQLSAGDVSSLIALLGQMDQPKGQ